MPLSSADSPLVAEIFPSPNHEPRRGVGSVAGPDLLLLHYTGMESTSEAIARLCDPDAKVSCHYLVREDGAVVQMVAEARRAWHAGASSWAGDTDVNSRSIGIEIANPGHDYGLPPFPAVQIEAVAALCRDILSRHDIPAARVLAHSDVAPARKQDPGEAFPWETLARRGVGLWVPPAPLDSPGPSFAPGDEGGEVAALQAALAAWGYGIPENGRFDEVTRLVVAAFQRHFRPALVDGVADPSTRATLEALEAKSDSLFGGGLA